MFRSTIQSCAVLMVVVSLLGGCSNETPQNADRPPPPPLQQQLRRGEELFKQFCAPCHPDGGNVSDPALTLRGSALRSHHITKPRDIVRIMRIPISRMISFDAANSFRQGCHCHRADYVLYTFE